MKNCISRRSFLKAAGILGAAGALAACGGSSSTSTAASSTASSAAASAASTGASIKLWTYPIGGWGKDETVQELIASFNAKYPDIKVAVEYLDYTNGDDQVNTAIEGGSAPDLVMEGPERLVANWGAKGVMAPLNDLWTDDAKKDIYESVNSACHNDKGDYYEYPLCMTAHCMAVNMTKVKEVGADKYLDTDKHTWSTEGFLNTVDALYKGGYENVAAIYCSGQGGDQGTRAIINNMYGGTFTDAAHTKYTADSAENIKAIQTLYDAKGVNFDPSINGGEEITLFRNGTLQMAFCWNIAQQLNADTAVVGGGTPAAGTAGISPSPTHESPPTAATRSCAAASGASASLITATRPRSRLQRPLSSSSLPTPLRSRTACWLPPTSPSAPAWATSTPATRS